MNLRPCWQNAILRGLLFVKDYLAVVSIRKSPGWTPSDARSLNWYVHVYSACLGISLTWRRQEQGAAILSKHAWTSLTCLSTFSPQAKSLYSQYRAKCLAYHLTICSGFLEGLCDHLYDHLRPRILHEPALGTLCEVCTVIQALMVQDIIDDDDDDVFSDSASEANDTPKPLSRLQIDQLLRMVLQDAQTRLVFRAQALVQADVTYYVAKPEDLDYPAKLISGK